MINTLNFFGKSPQKISNGVNRCGAPISAPHFSVFARLASGAFYETIVPMTFWEIINFSFTPEISLTASLFLIII
jgi:hypothetical protein